MNAKENIEVQIRKAMEGLPASEIAKLQSAVSGLSKPDAIVMLRSLHEKLGDLLDRLEKKKEENETPNRADPGARGQQGDQG